MLKSRRGLLAAGLAVAVVGALGVASTLNAGAEEIPGAQDATAAAPSTTEAADPGTEAVEAAEPEPESSASAASTLDVVSKPPALLPWGARPQRIRKGRAGASSSALRGSGADIAAADTSGAVVARPKFAPKGRTGRTTYLKSETTDAPPPPQPAAAAAATSPPVPSDPNSVKYLYSVGSQAAETEGIYSTMTVARPRLNKEDYHSLAELSLHSGAKQEQTVEVGWTVDRQVNGDDDPHLFVFNWINNKPGCYNGCGFKQVSTNIKPGDTLAYDVTKKFGIEYHDNAWWIAYDSEWVGYFPEKLWNDEGVTFNKTNYVQSFGEIAASDVVSCSQMGNGKPPSDVTAARSSVSFVNGPPVNLYMRALPKDENNNTQYGNQAWEKGSTRTFRFGGPLADPCPAPAPTASASQ